MGFSQHHISFLILSYRREVRYGRCISIRLTLVGLLILWSLIRRIPSKNMKNFHIHFGFLKGFDMSGEFYKDDTKNNK